MRRPSAMPDPDGKLVGARDRARERSCSSPQEANPCGNAWPMPPWQPAPRCAEQVLQGNLMLSYI